MPCVPTTSPLELNTRRLEHLDVVFAAVAQLKFFDIFEHLLRFAHAAIVALVFVGQVEGREIVIDLPHQFRQRFAEIATKLLVGKCKSAFAIFAPSAQRQTFHQREITRLGIAKCLLGVFLRA